MSWAEEWGKLLDYVNEMMVNYLKDVGFIGGHLNAGVIRGVLDESIVLPPHAPEHEAGGSDEIDLGFLAGVINDAQHGSRAGGTLHEVAVAAGAAGFMSGADKSKLDGIAAGANISGTIAAGQIAFGSGANVLDGDDALLWNDVTKRMGIGVTTTLRTALQVAGNLAVSNPGYDFQVDYAAPTIGMLMASNNGHAFIRLGTLTANTADDPYLLFTVAGAINWSLGPDNSDSDKFKLSAAGTLGTNDWLVITTAGDVGLSVSPSARLDINTGAMRLAERTAPSAPGANAVLLYAEDNGAGKTRLMALFNTGAAQQVAIQP